MHAKPLLPFSLCLKISAVYLSNSTCASVQEQNYSTVIQFVSASLAWVGMMFAYKTDEHECQVCNNNLTRSPSFSDGVLKDMSLALRIFEDTFSST